ncbi:MAG: 8-amino-7-oxononanoate synthase [Flavobacterium sp.]|jgi:8-amino-7-oxononanoate synthase
MRQFPKNLEYKLTERSQNNSLRQLSYENNLIDFSSNDYLGYAKSEELFDATHRFLSQNKYKTNGATGSRLLSGNHALYEITEKYIANFHQQETALIFNSGYDANIGFFGSVPQRNDIILYDELCHASIRDGIKMSNAKAYKFNHNDFEHLEFKIKNLVSENTNSQIYVVTESVFSMDGDTPNLEQIAKISNKYDCNLVVDEAHSVGVFGDSGQGLIHLQNLQDSIFAQIVTFGKGLGCHGAAILGNRKLQNYLINFARSFIYTTGLSPHSVASILLAYQKLNSNKNNLAQLKANIQTFNQTKMQLGLKPLFVYSKSAIQCAIIPGNENIKAIANKLQEKGFDVKPILSPTVPKGQERLRFCLHSYNNEKEILEVLSLLSNFVF